MEDDISRRIKISIPTSVEPGQTGDLMASDVDANSSMFCVPAFDHDESSLFISAGKPEWSPVAQTEIHIDSNLVLADAASHYYRIDMNLSVINRTKKELDILVIECFIDNEKYETKIPVEISAGKQQNLVWQVSNIYLPQGPVAYECHLKRVV